MPSNFFQSTSWQESNYTGSLILNDAGLRLNQLSPGSYSRMIDLLETGGDFSFQKQPSGLFEVVGSSDKKDFWDNLLYGDSNDFIGGLNDGLRNSKESDSAQSSFKDWFKKIGDFVAYGPIGLGKVSPVDNDIGGELNTTVIDPLTEKYGGLIIRVGLGIIGAILLVVGLVFMFKGEVTNAVVGNVGKALKGD